MQLFNVCFTTLGHMYDMVMLSHFLRKGILDRCEIFLQKDTLQGSAHYSCKPFRTPLIVITVCSQPFK